MRAPEAGRSYGTGSGALPSRQALATHRRVRLPSPGAARCAAAVQGAAVSGMLWLLRRTAVAAHRVGSDSTRVVWCGVVWCGVVWCGLMSRDVAGCATVDGRGCVCLGGGSGCGRRYPRQGAAARG